jgi:hypothetical protein
LAFSKDPFSNPRVFISLAFNAVDYRIRLNCP